MVYQILELYAFRMIQEKYIERLMDGSQRYLFLIIGKQKTTILCDNQATQRSPRRLNAELFQNRHTDGIQQKVCSTLSQNI